ncbi:MAG: hypothetical protein EOO56_15255 [Hymenobacter sp.]|nr:MAG: hypothetical protein EOO56_15255 [Hymenobacter sp.]
MSKPNLDRNTPIRYGNAFPQKGILAGVGRMISYLLLLAGLVIVLGAIVFGLLLKADSGNASDNY